MRCRGPWAGLLLALVAACEAPIPTAAPDAPLERLESPAGRAASIVFHNGVVRPVSGRRPAVEAIAVLGDRIMALGPDHTILRLAGPSTTVVDLQGATVLPGIVDAHTHLFNDAWRLGLDLHGAQDLALRNGITTLANLFSNPTFVREMEAFDAAGDLRIRTSLYLIYTDNCGVPEGDWWKAYPPTREFGERLRIGGIKLFADGGTCGEPAVSVEFYPGSGFGDLFLGAEDVAAAVRAAESSGHQVVVHAIGDRAVEVAQDGIEMGLQGRRNRLRHRIDHNTVVRDDLIPRYAEIGIQPVVFGYLPLGLIDPEPGTCEGGPRNAFYQSFEGDTRALLDGLSGRVAWHGDDPFIGPVNPFGELHNMITRFRAGGACPPQDWQLDTRITAREGLEMMTIQSAHALFREREVGSLRVGKLADLIVVPEDPLTMDPAGLWDLVVSMTMIDGVVEYCRAGRESLCPGVRAP